MVEIRPQKRRSFLTRTKRRKMVVFQGWGGGGVPTGAGVVDGGVDQGALIPGQGVRRVGLAARLGGYPPELASVPGR